MRPRLAARLPVLLLAALAVACRDGLDVGTEQPDLAGEVAETKVFDPSRSYLIRGAYFSDPRDIVREIVVHVEGPVFAEDSVGRLREVERTSIRAGDHLTIWTTGVELRSLPPQVTARRVIVRWQRP